MQPLVACIRKWRSKNEAASTYDWQRPGTNARPGLQTSRPVIYLTIRFRHVVGRRPLELSSAQYTNRFGEPFSVEQFKYYISAIRVVDEDGHEELLMQDPHLIDESDSASLTLHFSTDQRPIRAIRWLLGVDSAATTGKSANRRSRPYARHVLDLE